MSKRSGFAVKITAFIEASAKVPAEITIAMDKINFLVEELKQEGFIQVDSESRFMLSRELPDEPKAAQAVDLTPGGGPGQGSAAIHPPTLAMPPIPQNQRRA